MQNSNSTAALRRSSRVEVNVPVLVTSLAPGSQFSELCETLVVNAHGCAMRSPVRLDAGVLLHFHTKDGRDATAKVVSCQPLDPENQSWRLGARLDRPQNFWGLESFPEDWSWLHATAGPRSESAPAKLIAKDFRTIQRVPEKIPASLKTMLDNLQKQVAEERLQALMADTMKPLVAEVAGLREKVMRSQSKERSKFEVSLSHIPPELQVQLEARLRKEMGPRVLDEARTQSAQVLESAKLAIEQVTSHSHTEFRQRVSQDLQAVEKRIQGVSADTVTNLRDHQRREMGEFHQHVVDAGNHLNRVSEELLQAQQHTLAETSEGHRRKLEQLQATVAAEASRLRAEVADLNNRIAVLGESARALESGLDIRLSNLASNTVRDARTQLESSVETMLDNLDTRGAGKVAEQVTNASERLAILQTEIEETISESARVLAERMLEAFEKSLDEEARKSVERCRGALAHGVNSLLQSLGEQFQMDVAISEHRERDWTK